MTIALPVTGALLLPFAAYEVILAMRVVAQRVGSKTSFGDKRRAKDTEQKTEQNGDSLTRAVRAHGNFIEGVPLALLLTAVNEINGGDCYAFRGALVGLLVARILHSEFGIHRGPHGIGFGRVSGTAYTQLYILGMGLYSAFLIRKS